MKEWARSTITQEKYPFHDLGHHKSFDKEAIYLENKNELMLRRQKEGKVRK